jgi:hypothetical protein
MAMLATGALASIIRDGAFSQTAPGSPAEPASCVATVLPDPYYQAIAEMTACTGRPVAVEIAPADPLWAIGRDLPPPGADGIRVAP